MSMKRAILRNMARSRLKDAGYERVNQRLGMTAGGKSGHIDTVISQRHGRKNSRRAKLFEKKLRAAEPPVWRRVLNGDLSRKAEEAEKKASMRRAIRHEAERMKRKRKREPATA